MSLLQNSELGIFCFVYLPSRLYRTFLCSYCLIKLRIRVYRTYRVMHNIAFLDNDSNSLVKYLEQWVTVKNDIMNYVAGLGCI